MFAKPSWFRKSRLPLGITPTNWQGWTYAIIWLAVVTLPAGALLMREQPLEASVWVVAATGLLLWDVRQLWSALHPPATDEEVFYIGEDEGESEEMATRHFDMRVRR